MALIGWLKLIPIRYWLALGIVIGLVLGIHHYGHTKYKQGIAHELAEATKAHDTKQATLDVLTAAPSPYVDQYNAIEHAPSIPYVLHPTTATPCAPAAPDIVAEIKAHNHAHH